MRIFLRRVCVFDCVCDDGELDGYGVVMGLFEGLFREERITEYDEGVIWLLPDAFVCVCVRGCVQSIFEHLQTVFIIQIIPLLPCTLEPVVHWHTAEEDMRSLMLYHHSGLWLEINVFVRATSSRWMFMKAISKCSFELYSMQSFWKDATLYYNHTAYVNSPTCCRFPQNWDPFIKFYISSASYVFAY